jgi:hypothetical protein
MRTNTRRLRIILIMTPAVPPVVSPPFVVAMGLACSNDLKNYAGGSVATGKVSQAGQVKSEDPD